MKNHGWIVFAIVGLVLLTGIALMYNYDVKSSGEARKLRPSSNPPIPDGTVCNVDFKNCMLSGNTKPVLPASKGHTIVSGKIVTASFDASRGLEPMCEVIFTEGKQAWPVYNPPSNWWCGSVTVWTVPSPPPTSTPPVKKLGMFLVNRLVGDPPATYTINGVSYSTQVVDWVNASPNCFGSQAVTFVVNGQQVQRCEDKAALLNDGSIMVFMGTEKGSIEDQMPILLHIR